VPLRLPSFAGEKNFVFNVKKNMLNFEHFLKCTGIPVPEMYPLSTPPFRFLNTSLHAYFTYVDFVGFV